MAKYRAVEYAGGCVKFAAEFLLGHVDDFLTALWAAEDSNASNVCFDFAGCTRTFPNAMIPVCVAAMWLREASVTTTLVLPTNAWLRGHFNQVNWAHLVDPSHFGKSDNPSDRHLAASTFANEAEQRDLLNEIIERTLRTTEISKDELNALRWSLNEIAGNVLDHAQSSVGGIIQMECLRDRIAFCVADVGIGILKSLRPAYPYLRDSQQALELATRGGVTRDRSLGQGNGLSGSLRLASAFGGQFGIRSHHGTALWQPDLPVRQWQHSDPLPGTMIDLQLRRGRTVDIASVIAGDSSDNYKPLDVITEFHTTDDATSLLIRMEQDTFGFGNRPAGSQMRQKCMNLLRGAPDLRLHLDWTGIPVIASSYADEFVGKLFAELGPLAFGQRVQCAGLEPLVRRIIDRAIAQRIAQRFS